MDITNKGVILKHFLLILLILLLPLSASAATYYIAPTGNDTTGDGSTGTPWLTLVKGMAMMSSGDTLIVKDGTYTGGSNIIYYGGSTGTYPPFGSAGNYTIVKAEHDGEAIFDGEDARSMFDYTGLDAPPPYQPAYWQFEGLLWCNSTGPNVNLIGVSYVKFLRCGAYDCGDGNTNNFYIRHDDYVLLEGCYSYGTGRYKFQPYQSNHIIIRNCVGRHDRHTFPAGADVVAGVSMYSVSDGLVQNCIIVDSDQVYINVDEYAGCFAIPSTDISSHRVQYEKCIGLNTLIGGLNSAKDTWDSGFDNCVVWAASQPAVGQGVYTLRGTSSTVTNCTLGNVQGNSLRFFNGSDNDSGPSYMGLKNNIIYNHIGDSVLMYSVYYDSYNDFYGNSNLTGYIGYAKQTVNPLTNSLKYLPRIEAGSDLINTGESGGQIGASCDFLIGTPGTLWGEEGYNTVTATSMWPFPNEALIKSKFAAYDEGGVDGTRGFCGGTSIGGYSQTLTRYIWEYLGNGIPADIYGDTKKSLYGGTFYGTW